MGHSRDVTDGAGDFCTYFSEIPRAVLKRRQVTPAMPLDYAVDILKAATANGFDLRIDGDWSADARLGRQSRTHPDLDIVVEQRCVARLRAGLESCGYHDVDRDDTSPWNFVLGNDSGHEIDIHAIVLDENGNGSYGPADRGAMYPAASLTGTGVIGGLRVKCISPEWLIAFHTGYQLRETDVRDVIALWSRFGIDLPHEYAHLRENL